jgi:hypothetical protein
MFAALMIGHHLSWLEDLPSLLNDHSLAPTIAPAAHLRETGLSSPTAIARSMLSLALPAPWLAAIQMRPGSRCCSSPAVAKRSGRAARARNNR